MEGEQEANNSIDSNLENAIEALILDPEPQLGSPQGPATSSTYLTNFETLPSPQEITASLCNLSLNHALTREDSTTISNETENNPYAFITSGRYTNDKFYGIVIDTGASKHSTAGYNQYEALCKICHIPIDKSKAGAINVQFGIGSTCDPPY